MSGLLTRYFERRALDENSGWGLVSKLRGVNWSTHSGVNVTPDTAMQSTAVFACVRVIAETVASLPRFVYRRLPTGGRSRAPEHALYDVVHQIANPEMTAMDLFENLVGHMCLRGTGYAEIEYDQAGSITALWPLRPDRTQLQRGPDGQLWTVTQLPNGQNVGLPPWRVWRLRGFGTDPFQGFSPIQYARQAVALALATEEYGGKFFANDSRPGGVLKHPGQKALSDKAYERMKGDWEAMHGGLGNAHRIAILEEGVEWQQIGMGNGDAQFLETRQYQLAEIARIFRVQPHLIQDLSRSTNNNIEHQGIEFVVYTLRPWLVRIEQSAARDLFTKPERKLFYLEHLVDGLLRGDAKTRAEALHVMRQDGIINADEWREIENRNPIEDGSGKVYLVNGNMMPVEQAGMARALRAELLTADDRQWVAERPLPALGAPGLLRATGIGGANQRRRIATAYRNLIGDASTRILRREEADVMRQANKLLGVRAAPADFLNWLDEFYRGHPDFVFRAYLPVIRSLSEQVQAAAAEQIGTAPGMTDDLDAFVRSYVTTAASNYCWSSFGQLRQVIEQAQGAGHDPLPLLQQRFDEWREGRGPSMSRPEKLGWTHSVRAANAVARESWLAAGVRFFRWHSFGQSCPYCNALHGRTVGKEQHFIGKGEDFKPDGADQPLTTRRTVRHAPAHLKCDCSVEPE